MGTDKMKLEQLSLDTAGLVRNDHPDTARQAAQHQIGRSGTARRRVFELLARGGLTDEEIQYHLTMPANTQRPRRVELVDLGVIHDSGDRRRTMSGEYAIVWSLSKL